MDKPISSVESIFLSTQSFSFGSLLSSVCPFIASWLTFGSLTDPEGSCGQDLSLVLSTQELQPLVDSCHTGSYSSWTCSLCSRDTNARKIMISVATHTVSQPLFCVRFINLLTSANEGRNSICIFTDVQMFLCGKLPSFYVNASQSVSPRFICVECARGRPVRWLTTQV